jgi:dolichol-phosphate mannosyltransferase
MSAPPHARPSDLDLSVVIPARNEAGNSVSLIAEIHAALARDPGPERYEIVYVDDGSEDGTAAELAKAAEADTSLRVLRHARTCGQSQATLTGALTARGLWIATLDGDGQNDPADLARLLAARHSTCPAADRTLFIGCRGVRRDAFARRLASRLANALRRRILGDATPDSGCGMKLIRRDLLLSLPRFDALHRFMPALVIRAGGTVVSVSISHRARRHGRSKYGIVGRGLIGIVDLLGVMWLMRRHSRPTVIDPGHRSST